MTCLQFLTLAIFRFVSQPLSFVSGTLVEHPVEYYGIDNDQDQPGEDGDADTEEGDADRQQEDERYREAPDVEEPHRRGTHAQRCFS